MLLQHEDAETIHGRNPACPHISLKAWELWWYSVYKIMQDVCYISGELLKVSLDETSLGDLQCTRHKLAAAVQWELDALVLLCLCAVS